MNQTAAGWQALTAELDRWAEAGHLANFWWRDDDAVAATPALDQLLALHAESGIPLALAIIPAQAEAGLADRLNGLPNIAALQHGLTHANHAPAPEKKSEFPAARPLAIRLSDIEAGRNRLRQLFGGRLLPVLVPPWNRAAPDLLPSLPGLGFSAISSFRPRQAYWAAEGLAWLNTQVDPIDWHGGQATEGVARSLATVVDILQGMRMGSLPPQPVGLLTHHLRHDEAVWDFTATFLRTTRHPAVRWIDAATALETGRPAPVMTPS